MDEQRKLVIELQAKLAELDQRVGNYRRDMVAQFEKFAEDLLRNTPKEVSDGVSETIAASKGDYQALYPACESGSTAGISQEPKQPQAPPEVAEGGDGEDDAPTHLQYRFPKPTSYFRGKQEDIEVARSPHEREREFQGVFTPIYLPLLGDNRLERRASHDTPTTPPSPRSTLESSQVDASTDPRSSTATPDIQKPPLPKRRDTEDSTVSDTSEGTVRRSALRRSSNSSMKASPRRVRFDVEGVEVLPTSSPLPSTTLLSEGSPLSQPSADDEPGSEQVEDISYFQEEESPPRPKRISSSQRLLALSRSTKEEDGITWMTVAAPPDGSPSIEKVGNSNDSLAELSAQSTDTSKSPKLSSESLTSENQPAGLRALSAEAASRSEAGQKSDDTESDEDTLDMPSLSSMKGRKTLPPAAILSPTVPHPNEAPKSPTASHQISDRRWKDFGTLGKEVGSDADQDLAFGGDDLDDEVFNFEEQQGYHVSPPEELDEEEDSASTESPTSPAGNLGLSQYSQSPGRPIIRQPVQQQHPPAVGSLGVIGSYRGHPFSMPVVNEDMHAKIAAMDDIKSFVGSVDGRSGVDDGDMASYRVSGKGASFTPRSFTERMFLEDLQESERSRQKH